MGLTSRRTGERQEPKEERTRKRKTKLPLSAATATAAAAAAAAADAVTAFYDGTLQRGGLSFMVVLALTKNGCTNTHFSRSCGNRLLKVVRHPHRQLLKLWVLRVIALFKLA
mgnify:CR=1 FL=1